MVAIPPTPIRNTSFAADPKILEGTARIFISPDESKDLQVPSGLSMPSFMNCTEVFGLSSKLTPPTRAASHWPWRMAWKAFSKASKLEEQAVSMAVLGPGGEHETTEVMRQSGQGTKE